MSFEPDETQNAHMEQIKELILSGKNVQDREMFKKQGFRGLQVLPYPKHVRQMIAKIQHKVNKNNPAIKVPIYRGHETSVNVDQKIDKLEHMKTQFNPDFN